MAGVVHVPWYATIGRKDSFCAEITRAAPLALRYGATQYAVHLSLDDRYKILQMAWFESKAQWYAYWEGPEMTDLKRRCTGHFQVPVVYVWHDELVAGALGPEVELMAEPAPEPQPEPQATA
jgi:hypothetical protein